MEKTLVVKLIGKNLSPYIIIEQVKYLRRIKAKMFPTNIGNMYIVFRFYNEQNDAFLWPLVDF